MAGLWSLVDPAKPWSYPDIFPQSLSFERWKIVWETTSLPEAMFNSYTIAPTVSLITILLSLSQQLMHLDVWSLEVKN